MRARGVGLVAVLGIVLAAALGPAAAGASAEVLVNQQPGPSSVAVPSDGTADWSGAADDFDVPVGTHWRPEAIQVYGEAEREHPRTFDVRIFWGGGSAIFLAIPETRVFSERVTVAGGPDYLIPLAGAPRLDHGNDFESGQYWIAVQAEDGDGEDEWSWLTGPDTPGTAPAREESVAGAEPGLAFQLLGTATQLLSTEVTGGGVVTSSPAGVSCATRCVTELPRGTTLTLTGVPTAPGMRFDDWEWTGSSYPPRTSPCAGTGPCTITLNQDMSVPANFDYVDEVDVLRVVRDRRRGRGELIVWLPGEGVLSMFSQGLRVLEPELLPAGLARIPLVPDRPVAKHLHRDHLATVSASVNFRPAKATYSGSVHKSITLVRKPPRKPAHRVH